MFKQARRSWKRVAHAIGNFQGTNIVDRFLRHHRFSRSGIIVRRLFSESFAN